MLRSQVVILIVCLGASALGLLVVPVLVLLQWLLLLLRLILQGPLPAPLFWHTVTARTAVFASLDLALVILPASFCWLRCNETKWMRFAPLRASVGLRDSLSSAL